MRTLGRIGRGRVSQFTLTTSSGTRVLYAQDKATANFSGTFKQAGSNTDQGTATSDGNVVIFSGLTNETFTLTVKGASASDGISRAAINAIQLVQSPYVPPPPAPVITSSGTASATVGNPFTYSITADNGPTSFSASGLPAGLSVNPTTGLISGTPVGVGTNTITLSASNAAGTGTKTLLLTITVNSNEVSLEPVQTGVTNQLSDTFFINGQCGYAVGNDGTVLITTNAGVNWSRSNTPFTNDVTSIRLVGPVIFITGSGGLLCASYDSGQSWIPFYVSTTVPFYSASFLRLDSGFAVGGSGTICSYDGSLWTQRTVSTTSDLYAVKAVETTAYAVGANGTICRYNGSQWVAQSAGTFGGTFYGVDFFNASFGYVVGSGGIICRTTNGGTNWVAQNSGTTNTLRQVYAIDLNRAYVVGDHGTVLQTTDGGSTWVTIATGTNTGLRGLFWIDGLGFITGLDGAAFRFFGNWTTPNSPPSVVLYNPISGTQFYSRGTVTLNAIAGDLEGTVTKVEFYQGATLLYSDTVAPFTYNWSNLSTGSLVLTAMAYDNQGAKSVSTPVNITVLPAADLTLTATFADPFISGSNLLCTLIVTNRGDAPAMGVALTDILPSSFRFLSATTTQGTTAQSGNTFWANLGTIHPAGKVTLTLQFIPVSAGVFSNTAWVILNSVDTHPADNTTQMALTVTAPSFPRVENVTLTDNSRASLYPSTMTVAGLQGVISKVKVTFTHLTHSYSRDIDALLVGPGGQNVMLMSDIGVTNASGGIVGVPINGLTFTFDDDAAHPIGWDNQMVSGTYRPTNFFTLNSDNTPESLPGPAPLAPYGTALSVFKGTDPNGTWSLYLQDDEAGDVGSLLGWSLEIATASAEAQPPLKIGHSGTNIVLSWSSGLTGYSLQTALTNTAPVSWTNVSATPVTINGQNYLTNAPASPARFYRLFKF